MDTSSWKWFRYDKIFDIKHGFYNKKPEDNPDGDIPFIGATDSNNGVTSHSDLETIAITTKTGDGNNAPIEEKIFENCIAVTNNGSVGYAYYQAKPFTCTHDVNPLYLKGHELTPNIALFLCAIIEKERFRWAYGRKWRPIRMPSSKIKLPITPKGSPDWQYMENFVKDRIIPQLPKKAQKVWLQKYDTKPQTQEKMKLNTDEWKWFEYSELFYISGSKTTPKEELESYGKGKYPYVTTQAVNNGVENFYNYCTEKGGVLTVDSAVLGFCSYQEQDFSASDHVEVLTPKFEMNRYIALFLTTIINREQYRYSYGRKCSQIKLRLSRIKLPATPSGEPDWQFMEDYIKSLPNSKNLEPSNPKEVVDELVEMKKEMIKMRRQMEAINTASTVNIIGSNVTYLDQSKTYNVK